jgi:three-Cys-motif partner protein
MTTEPPPFFEQRREWSKRKHEVLTGYAAQFARILGRSGRTVYLVDAFAGRGFYGTGTEQEPGSPLLAAQLAEDLASNGRYNLRCINVEADSAAFRDLSDATKPYARLVENRQGRFAEHVDQILSDVGSHPTLFFLDPFGIGGLEWSLLEKLARRSSVGKTEFLINLNVPKIDRHAGWLDSFGQRPQQAFIELLNRTLGSAEWQSIWDEPRDKAERYRLIVKYYGDRMRRYLRFRTGAYPVRTVETEQLKYQLLFGSKHPLGIRIMSSIMYGVEHRYLAERAAIVASRPRQLTFEFIQDPPSIEELEASAIADLEADILAVGMNARRLTFGQLQDSLVDKWFGRMVEKHHREVCRKLMSRGMIENVPGGIKDSSVLVFRSPPSGS